MFEDFEVVGLGLVNSLRFLELRGAQISAANNDGIEHLTNLRVLVLSLFEGRRLPDLSKLISLETVDFSWCSRMATVSGLSLRSTNLRILTLDRCHELDELPGLQKLANIRNLHISYCGIFKTVLGLDELIALEELDIRNCFSLNGIPNLSNFPRLKVLRLNDCES